MAETKQVVINSDNYAAACVRTEADYAHFEKNLQVLEAYNALRNLIDQSIVLGKRFNDLKKYLFYNSPSQMIGRLEMKIPAEGEAALARAADPTVRRLIHAAIGNQTETGEEMEILSQHIFMGKPLDAVHFQEEVGDSNWYNGIAAAALGKTVTEIEQQNIDKLTARYPDKFTTFLAENRDLAAERKALEGNKPEAPKPAAPAPVEPKKTEVKPVETKTAIPKQEAPKPAPATVPAAAVKTAEKK